MAQFERLTGRVELIPVVEFSPWDFSAHAEQYAKNFDPSWWKPDSPERIEYWKRCLLDSGITNLELTSPRMWLVAVDQLNNSDTLKKLWHITYLQRLENQQPEELIKVSAEDIELKDDILRRILGGYILSVEGKLLLEPMCCCDLATFDDWQRSIKYKGSEWSTLWIGHPWCFVRYEDDYLVFSDLHDDNNPPLEQFALKVNTLEAAVEQAENKLNSFWKQLVEVVNQNPFDPNL